MMTHIRVAPSILAAPHTTIEEVNEAAKQAEQAGADFLHVDVMDGQFVTNETIWNDSEQISKIKTTLPLDVHIMIKNPDLRFLDFVHAGATRLAYHLEAADEPELILHELHQWGVLAGLVINPETPVDALLPYLHLFDYIIIMSVHPGKAGQEFIPDVLEKVRFIRKNYPKLDITIDGGINEQTAQEAARAGVTTFIAGSAFYKHNNKKQFVKQLQEALNLDFA